MKPRKASPTPRHRPIPSPRAVLCGELFDGETETLGSGLEDLTATEELDCEAETLGSGPED